ncbi:MAG: response regulator [Pseudomonadota bacterium]
MAKRVLLAEDEPNIVESLKFLLGRGGFDVTVRTNGREALETALTDPPDVFLLDVMLPEIDGFEVLKRLRASQFGMRARVIMLTAKGQREERDRALAHGADLFISKPFSNTDLMRAVTDLANRQPV